MVDNDGFIVAFVVLRLGFSTSPGTVGLLIIVSCSGNVTFSRFSSSETFTVSRSSSTAEGSMFINLL